MGKTILISSHILSDLEQICNKIGIIEKGKLVFCGRMEEAMQRLGASRVVEVRVEEPAEEAMERLAECPGVTRTQLRDGTIHVALDAQCGRVSDVAGFLVRNGFSLRLFQEQTPDLEDAFMRMTKGEIS